MAFLETLESTLNNDYLVLKEEESTKKENITKLCLSNYTVWYSNRTLTGTLIDATDSQSRELFSVRLVHFRLPRKSKFQPFIVWIESFIWVFKIEFLSTYRLKWIPTLIAILLPKTFFTAKKLCFGCWSVFNKAHENYFDNKL